MWAANEMVGCSNPYFPASLSIWAASDRGTTGNPLPRLRPGVFEFAVFLSGTVDSLGMTTSDDQLCSLL